MIVTYSQAKVVYEDATLNTDAVIAGLVSRGLLNEEEAEECRAVVITHLNSCDDDHDVTIRYRIGDGKEQEVYYSTHNEDEDVWNPESDYIGEPLCSFVTEIGRLVGI